MPLPRTIHNPGFWSTIDDSARNWDPRIRHNAAQPPQRKSVIDFL